LSQIQHLSIQNQSRSFDIAVAVQGVEERVTVGRVVFPVFFDYSDNSLPIVVHLSLAVHLVVPRFLVVEGITPEPFGDNF
jgi:hypothetical protein